MKQDIGIWNSFFFFFLFFHVDHMTGKRSAKEVDKTLTPQPPLISNLDSISQKSQGESALLCLQGGLSLKKVEY